MVSRPKLSNRIKMSSWILHYLSNRLQVCKTGICLYLLRKSNTNCSCLIRYCRNAIAESIGRRPADELRRTNVPRQLSSRRCFPFLEHRSRDFGVAQPQRNAGRVSADSFQVESSVSTKILFNGFEVRRLTDDYIVLPARADACEIPLKIEI